MRICRDMIKATDDYQAGRNAYSRMVAGLEGLFDAGEFKDKAFVREWYEIWGTLETTNADHGDKADPRETADHVAAMRRFREARI